MGGRLRRQNGAGTLELIGLLPLLLVAVLVMWQFTLGAYTLVVAEAAVRDGARAAADGSDARAAAQTSAGDLAVVVEDPAYQRRGELCQVTLRLSARVPLAPASLIRGAGLTIARQAIMPADARLCP